MELFDESNIDDSGATLAVYGMAHAMPDKYYEDIVREKRAFSTLVKVAGKPVYRIIWQIYAQSHLSILLAQSLHGIDDIRLLGLAIDKLAIAQKAVDVIFSTSRKALIKQAAAGWGAKPFQLWLKKEYVTG